MELRNFVRVLARGWWIVTISALAAVTIALGSILVSTPMYRVTASLIVSPNKALVPQQNLVDTLGTLDKRSIIATYAEVLNSSHIYNDSLAALHVQPQDLRGYTHSAVVLPDANVLELSVTGPDPQTAAILANTMSARGIDYIKGLYQPYDLNLLDPAVPTTSPYSPQPIRDLSLALVLGLAIGAVLAALGEQLSSSAEVPPRRATGEKIPGAYQSRYYERR